MAQNITLVRGDDTNFFDQILLIIYFKTVLNLDGYKLRLTIENPTNIIKQYEVQHNAVEINFGKIDSSTFSVGEHRANLKLIDTLGRVKTTYTFNIYVQDEFEANVPNVNEYELELELDSDGISKYKDYEQLYNKPSINNVILSGNKTLEELGIQHIGNYSTIEYVDSLINNVNSEIDLLESNVNKKSDLEYVNNELELKADKTELNIKANVSDIPTRVSQLVNDEGYLTEHQDISNKADIDYVEELLDRKSDKNDTYTKVDVDALIDNINEDIDLKQNKLIAGNNIFIDENNVISATGEASSVTSVNGMTGDVNLTAQDVGALPDTTEIPSLEGYVKDTDYANNTKAGIIKLASVYGTLMVDSFGTMGASIRNLEQYNAGQNYMFISKGTLENIKDDYVKRGLTENAIEFTDEEKTNARDLIGSVGFKDYASYKEHGVVKINTTFGIGTNASGEIHNIKASDDEITGRSSSYKPIVPKSLDLAVKTGITTNTLELTEDEKASAKQWLGYATSTDIMQAIASIPQFSISIVEALPETGEKMTLYLVSKGGESPDVYDEYIWIEETSTFEFLGTTAVDLTDYVKNTDYATNSVAGVVKPTSYYGLAMATGGYLTGMSISQADWERANDKALISKATFNNVRDSYIKTGITENSTVLTDEESASARTWLGAVGNTDYVTSTKAGIVSIGAHYGTQILNEQGLIGASVRNLSQYTDASTSLIIGKGTLENVLTQYSKTVLTTQADYDALETKDANTLYLIEE